METSWQEEPLLKVWNVLHVVGHGVGALWL
jgi:hypothetical protein